MERLTVPVEWKASADDPGVLEGYASTFGNVDLGDDVVVKGAFLKTIGRLKSEGIPLLADHVASVASVLGSLFTAAEDRKGLAFKARFSAAPSAQDARIKLLEGHVGKLSMGYEATKFSYEEREGKTVRVLQEVKLWEVSVVVFPMNPEAVVSRVKSLAGALDDESRMSLAAELVESSKPVEEKATSNEVRDQLNVLVRDAYGADGVDVWVRDFDEFKVWFDIWSPEDGGTFEQGYEATEDGGFSLDGDRIKVRAVTSYVAEGKSVTITGTPGTVGSQLGDESSEGGPDEGSHEQAGDEPAGGASDEGAHWDHWASEAVLHGGNPDEVAELAERAGLNTTSEYLAEWLSRQTQEEQS